VLSLLLSFRIVGLNSLFGEGGGEERKERFGGKSPTQRNAAANEIYEGQGNERTLSGRGREGFRYRFLRYKDAMVDDGLPQRPERKSLSDPQSKRVLGAMMRL
jgi:hypothetical protein